MTASNPLTGNKIENLVYATSNTGRFSVGGELKYVQRFKYFDENLNKNVIWEAKENNTLSRDQILRIELLLTEALKAAVDQETNRKESDQKKADSQPDFWKSWNRMTIETDAKPSESRLEFHYSPGAESGRERLKKYKFSYTPPNSDTIKKADDFRRTAKLHLNLTSLVDDTFYERETKSNASGISKPSLEMPRASPKTPTKHKTRRSAELALGQPTPRAKPMDERNLNLSLTPTTESDSAAKTTPRRKKSTVTDVNRTAAHQLGQRAAESKRARSSEAP